ncbi:MAG: HAD family hydrolase [Verrucomicrobiota bacterium]
MKHLPNAVIFDLDGTLLDTIEDMTDAVNAALEKQGYPTRSVDDVKCMVGEGPTAFANAALPSKARQPEIIANLIKEYRAEYAQRWTQKTRPYPGILDLLKGLNDRCIAISILSNKREEVVKEAVAHFLPGIAFEEIRGARPETPLKPDTTAALQLAQRIGSAPKQMLFVGDTKTDMQTACSANMTGVGVLWGFRTADELRRHGARHLVRNPLEILT